MNVNRTAESKGMGGYNCILQDGATAQKYMYAPHNDVSVNDGPIIGRWSHKIMIQYYNTIVLQLPMVFSTVTPYTGL
jgi:hypothetical protein